MLPATALDDLLSPRGSAAISQAEHSFAQGSSSLQTLTALRSQYPPELARQALEQALLHSRAKSKFPGFAHRLILLPDALEQASRHEVANHRATRLTQAGITRIVDAGAGIGADTIALANNSISVIAIEQDPLVAAALQANVSALELDVEVRVGRIEQLLPAIDPAITVYVDPARRDGGRRIFDPQLSSPPLSYLRSLPNPVVAKMSPGIGYPDLPVGWEAEWVSTFTEQGRSVVEACLWSSHFRSAPRRASVIGRTKVASVAGSPDSDLAVGSIGKYLYEPDGALNRAELTAHVAALAQASLISPRIAYLSSDTAVTTDLAQRFDVLDVLPWSQRKVRAAVASYDLSDIVVKKRGIELDPARVRKELLPKKRDRGAEQLVVIICRRSNDSVAILARAAR